jgi:hypothetical protein
MEESDYLYTLAEIAISFVGFAAIVIAIRSRSGPSGEADSFLIKRIIDRCLAAIAFSLLPMLLHFLGATPERMFPHLSGLSLIPIRLPHHR